MKAGLLWFDDSDRVLAEKVVQAARRHREKYGDHANMCYVHPAALGGEGPQTVGRIRVAALPNVLRHHFWIGQEGEACLSADRAGRKKTDAV